MIVSNDPLANYVCGKQKEGELNELVSGDVVDYGIIKKKDLEIKKEIDPRKSISYFQVKNIEEGVEWYRKLDDKIPEELLPLFSRYNFGDLSTLTKKQLRNENKKKKKKKIDPSIHFNNDKNKNPFIIKF